jgi:hypothetical protein
MSSPPSITARTVHLLKTGLFVSRACCVCRRQHLALVIAPMSAPCLICVRAAPPSQPPPPPPGRRWSAAFLAHLEEEHARALAPNPPRPTTTGAVPQHVVSFLDSPFEASLLRLTSLDSRRPT